MCAQTQVGHRGSVVCFAKLPEPGKVKTRLCPPLTPDEAAALYAAFLRRIAVPAPGWRTLVYGTPEARLAELRAYVHPDVELRPQRGADLWQRLGACFAETLSEAAGPVVVRGTDSPDLPPERLGEALAACGPGRVVLGPDPGGGYYLIGLARPVPELFALDPELPAERVFAATAARASGLGLQVVALPIERDVDTFTDLLALWRARGRQPATGS